jgi:hypothetical protein
MVFNEVHGKREKLTLMVPSYRKLDSKMLCYARPCERFYYCNLYNAFIETSRERKEIFPTIL